MSMTEVKAWLDICEDSRRLEEFGFGRLLAPISVSVTVLPSSFSLSNLGASGSDGVLEGKIGLGGLLNNAAFVDFGPRFRAGVRYVQASSGLALLHLWQGVLPSHFTFRLMQQSHALFMVAL
jgi:hypothetical protein